MRCVDLLTKTHPHEKVLIFTQFADTERYLDRTTRRAPGGGAWLASAATVTIPPADRLSF